MKIAKLFGVPILHSTINVATGPDWARDQTAEGVGEILLTERLLRA